MIIHFMKSGRENSENLQFLTSTSTVESFNLRFNYLIQGFTHLTCIFRFPIIRSWLLARCSHCNNDDEENGIYHQQQS